MNPLIQKNVPLADKNWFRTGGKAQFYAEPQSAPEFQEALSFAHNNALEICIIGEGANILISDEGFDGLVIRPALNHIEILNQVQGDTNNNTTILVTAGAGVSLAELIIYCLKNNIGGLEEFSGIPGTVGGSVFINVHYFEYLLSHFLQSATVINAQTGEITTVDNAWFNFGYNYSTLHKHEYYLIDATFKLKQYTALETAYAKGRSLEIIRHRVARYPSKGTCGSFFRNFHPTEVTLESAGKKMIYVAYYLDKIGVKGELACGDAIVSYQHANMIVNKNNATTQDIVTVVRTMQELVKSHFGITPQPECRFLGFKKYPLL